MDEKFGSAQFDLGQHDGKQILKAFLYSLTSATFGFLISLLPLIHVQPQYALILAALIPTINTGLVAGKRFFEDRSNIIE